MLVAWDRQPGESEEAHAAFRHYLEMGTDRSIDGAWNKARPEGHKSKRPGNWFNWSVKFKWVERCREYDNWLAEQERAAQAKVARQKAAERERRRQQAIDDDLQVARAIRAKAAQMLTNIDAKDVTPAQMGLVTSAFKTASELERTALELALGKVQHEVSGPGGGPIQIETDDELTRRLKQLPPDQRGHFFALAATLADGPSESEADSGEGEG